MRFFIACLLIFSASITSQAQNYLKAKSADYIRRTAYIVHQTHKEIVKLDSITKDGKFATAVAHQRMARKCYEIADYKNAIYHSALSRRLAVVVYSTYNPMFPSKFKDTTDERELVKTAPTDKVLQENLLKANPGIKFNDNDYLGDNKLYKLDVDDLVQP